jgi:VWFA-related protein
MSWLVRWTAVPIWLVVAVSTGTSQTADNQQPPQAGYTLHASAREVVTDVLVMDHKGNPIRGLPESDFHIFDNGNAQHIASFVEHTQSEATAPLQKNAANDYNNDIVIHPPGVFNLILLDTATITVPDQMYLRQQLDRFIATLPPDEPFAVLARSNEHVIMLANFTSDHEQLLTAIHREIPRLRMPGSQYVLDVSLLNELCAYLQQYPGRKNVLWLNGGSNLFLNPDPEVVAANSPDMRVLYDELELARIALYPIDVRGLQVTRNPGTSLQQLLMTDEADATGGRAVFNTNGIADAAKHIADTDATFYTLTYSPQEVKLDNKWHKIKVNVDGADYQVSYRHGYFDDGSNLQHEEGGRKRLLQGGDTVAEVSQAPIVFDVRVRPADNVEQSATRNAQWSFAPPKKGERAYELHYSVPEEAFSKQTVGDQDKLSIGVAVLAFNQDGRSISRTEKKVTVTLSQERASILQPGSEIGFDEPLDVPDGQDFLYVVVWNPDTAHLGTVQIPLTVEKAKADSGSR